MKNFPMASLLFLVLILSVDLGAATRGSDVAKFCCFQYSQKTLPWKQVHSYEFTRNICSLKAVIFTTKRGRKVCAQPKEEWVQRHISKLRAQQQL
ncbi:C-C motif chemokine 26 [Bos indicus]|uniref:C-C motif chemokine n=5 Tax=Bos TaxID=9903 RepID=A0A3Q1M5V9_BOVIN|nr:C-C motif chemokine 26 precursor [Bos taurus]XP_005892894.1 PREDICTED: C-C motif chemokine 26 [Bos mutus]XP_019843882.1 PREDICTED: C-C motif chemokine 26 [Bos indicus]XP_027382883.1 C-C motif chemokine 26 [Bos indicus x Bos taurus]URM60735.1 CCL26 [Bos grunniens]ELR58460.1 C-C motif chemokine 26 [Bos mutus]DAA15186.1 TPA: chemokine ligand 26-like protein-like [Bos taurus]